MNAYTQFDRLPDDPVRRVDRLLRLPDVMHLTGMSRATIYRKADKGRFPKGIRMGLNMTGWYESEVARWIADPMGYVEA